MELSGRRMAPGSGLSSYSNYANTRPGDILKESVQEKRENLRQTKIDRIYDMIDFPDVLFA